MSTKEQDAKALREFLVSNPLVMVRSWSPSVKVNSAFSVALDTWTTLHVNANSTAEPPVSFWEPYFAEAYRDAHGEISSPFSPRAPRGLSEEEWTKLYADGRALLTSGSMNIERCRSAIQAIEIATQIVFGVWPSFLVLRVRDFSEAFRDRYVALIRQSLNEETNWEAGAVVRPYASDPDREGYAALSGLLNEPSGELIANRPMTPMPPPLSPVLTVERADADALATATRCCYQIAHSNPKAGSGIANALQMRWDLMFPMRHEEQLRNAVIGLERIVLHASARYQSVQDVLTDRVLGLLGRDADRLPRSGNLRDRIKSLYKFRNSRSHAPLSASIAQGESEFARSILDAVLRRVITRAELLSGLLLWSRVELDRAFDAIVAGRPDSAWQLN